MKTFAPVVLLLLLVLSACAPAAVDPGQVEIQQLAEPISFYPNQTGATWTYLPDGPRDAPRLYQRVEGPTSLGGEIWTAWRIVGRGLDITMYRQQRSDGVYLLREVRPGTQITFNPPLKELPAQNELRVGATWGGETTAQLFFPQASPQNQRSELTLNYRYTVVDRRSVTIEAGTFDVYVINFESQTTDEGGRVLETIHQESWFSPYVGDVRLKVGSGYYLIETNFPTDGSQARR
jgi:hypothetical protein